MRHPNNPHPSPSPRLHAGHTILKDQTLLWPDLRNITLQTRIYRPKRHQINIRRRFAPPVLHHPIISQDPPLLLKHPEQLLSLRPCNFKLVCAFTAAGTFEPKKWTESDVDIKVSHCGICGSDIHTLRSGWAPANYPVCVGHEIVGTAIRVGKSITHIQPGSRVGVGAQSDSCHQPDCEQCTTSNEHYCQRMNASTYNSKYATGEKSHGGYATHWRGPGHFVFAIPDALPSAVAAPMLCGGITVYSPLVRNGAGPGKRVGIIGIGGLGHFGILFAKALDCDYIVGISRRSDKRADALAMGANVYIAADDEKNWNRAHRQSLDLIVCTVSSSNMPLTKYFQLLRVGGTFIQVGAPEDVIPAFSAFSLMSRGVKFGGSMIGSPAEIREMLELAALKNVRSWVQERGMGDANGAVVDMDAGKARYRYVLVNEEEKTPRL